MNLNFSFYLLKKRFQQKIKGLAFFLLKLKITANQVTLFALLICALTGTLIFFSKSDSFRIYLLLVPVLFFFRILLNVLDGVLAVEGSQISNFGLVLNEFSDVLSDFFIFFPFLFFLELNKILLIVFMFLALLSEFAGVLAFMLCSKRGYEGPMSKPDRLFIFALTCISLGTGIFVDKLNYLLLVSNLLLLCTIYNRLRSGLRS